jgi:hypothetical protein
MPPAPGGKPETREDVVSGSKTGKFNADNPTRANQATSEGTWPVAARVAVSAALLFHLAALLVGALAAPPSSALERGLHPLFARYFQVIDQGYAYRYYAPEPGPTPIATATIRYADGRPDQTVRLPDRSVRPRLRYQRQLALANHLAVDFQAARAGTGDGSRSRWAQSYARHLALTHPGASSITLYSQEHLIPDPERVRQALAAPGWPRVDLDAEEFYTTPERIGEYPCDAF